MHGCNGNMTDINLDLSNDYKIISLYKTDQRGRNSIVQIKQKFPTKCLLGLIVFLF